MGARQERRHADPARLLQSQQDTSTRHSHRTRQPYRAWWTRLRSTHAFLRWPPTWRVRDQGAEGLRHAEAHVGVDGERPDILNLVLAESRLLGQLLQASGQRQRAAE